MRTCFETEAEMAYYRCLTLVYSFTGILWLVIRIQRALVSSEKIRLLQAALSTICCIICPLLLIEMFSIRLSEANENTSLVCLANVQQDTFTDVCTRPYRITSTKVRPRYLFSLSSSERRSDDLCTVFRID